MTYHNTKLSNLCLFEVCSLPALKPKSLFLVSYIWETGIVWYAVLFLFVKVSLVIHYSEHSSESVGGFVSYFNYLSTWWLLFSSVHWNFCMRVTGLHKLSLVFKTGHIHFCFVYAKASDYLFWVLRLTLTNLFSDFVTVDIRQQLS